MSVVYFAECDGLVKIGFTKDLSKRFSSMRTGNPRPMNVFATIEGGRSLEAKIHTELAVYRERNEWFRDCVEVRAAIAKFSERAAKRATALAALNKTADQAPRSASAPASLSEVDDRFHRLLHLPIIDDLTDAMNIEQIKGLPKGSLMDGIVRGEDRRLQFCIAMDILLDAHKAYDDLLDQAWNDMLPRPHSIYAAAGSIVSRAEQVFHQFIVEMNVRQKGGADQ